MNETFRRLKIRLGLISLSLAIAMPASAGVITEPFAGANNFSLIVAGDADLGWGVHVHGGGYIGGNLSIQGSNGGFGNALPPEYSLGMYVGGNITSPGSGTRQIALFNNDYYVGGSNSGAHFQNPGSQLTTDPLAPQTQGSIAGALSAKSSEMAALSETGATVDASDSNNIKINLTADELNVLNLNSSNASFLSNQNSNILFNNFTETTQLIINYAMDGALDFRAKNQNLGSSLFDNVVWNFVGGNDLTFANSVSTFKGSIFAADSHVEWNANDIDGQLIANSLQWSNTSQSHYYVPWGEYEEPSNVPEPSMFGLLMLSLLGLKLRGRANR